MHSNGFFDPLMYWHVKSIIRSGDPGQASHILYGQAGLTWFIKYPGLIQILHWITCVHNGIWSLN